MSGERTEEGSISEYDSDSCGEDTRELNLGLTKSPAITNESDRYRFPMAYLKDGARVSKEDDYDQKVAEMNFRELVKDVPHTTYATHGIHKHPAIFIPHIPRFIIREFTSRKNEDGERPIVLDPFNGSGTTGLEAKLLGRDYVGVEINPLSKLVSEVATTPIPPSIARMAKENIVNELKHMDVRYYGEYDIPFPDKTRKEHWFTEPAINELTTIRKCICEFDFAQLSIAELSQQDTALEAIGLDQNEVRRRISDWFILMLANTVFEVSNADPSVSKAHKSKKMRELIDKKEHPPDAVETYIKEINRTYKMLIDLWDRVYQTTISEGDNKLEDMSLRGRDTPLEENPSHLAFTDIRLEDTREFTLPEYKEKVDIAITSPPYINAMNYYRGTKLRLFWIRDLLSNEFKPSQLRKNIIGSNSVSLDDAEEQWDLPVKIKDVWGGSEKEFNSTNLPELDTDIEKIHNSSLTESKQRAYVTWKFFAEDIPRSLARVYEHLKPGGHFFFIIGENTIGGQQIKSHKYIAEVAQNLGKFERVENNPIKSGGYELKGFAWDEITNRDLFQGRNHTSGVIEGEWVIILQKPRS